MLSRLAGSDGVVGEERCEAVRDDLLSLGIERRVNLAVAAGGEQGSSR